jgi:hypothetical protein
MKTQRMSKKVGNKTRSVKSKGYKYNIENIVIMFLRMLNTVKLYHWKTISYPEHKATDELYSNLNSNIDTFVETMLGKKGGRINLVKQKTLPLLAIENINDFKNEVSKYKSFLINMSKDSELNTTGNSDLLNIRDEILGNLNQFTYLLTFK